MPDLNRITFSLALQTGNIPTKMKSIPIKTFAAQTKFRTNIGGPDLVLRHKKTYEIISYEGNAW